MSRVCMMCTVYCVLCAVYCVRCGAYCAVHTVRVADASYYMRISPSVPLLFPLGIVRWMVFGDRTFPEEGDDESTTVVLYKHGK